MQKIDSDKKFVVLDQTTEAGDHQMVFNGTNFPAGIYLCTVRVANSSKVWVDNRKIVLRK
jgi:hypothetical protein